MKNLSGVFFMHDIYFVFLWFAKKYINFFSCFVKNAIICYPLEFSNDQTVAFVWPEKLKKTPDLVCVFPNNRETCYCTTSKEVFEVFFFEEVKSRIQKAEVHGFIQS